MGDTITLNMQQQKRLQVLGWLEGGRLTAEAAATVLGLSRRQVLRLKGAYRREGIRAVVHGNSGRTAAHAVAATTREQVLQVARSEEYRGYNHTHLCEELAETQGIVLSRRTVARILRAAGMRSPRRRRPSRHRSRRERARQRGLLVQVDASAHDWLEGRGPRLTLVGAIDDATGELLAAHFTTHESSIAYLQLLRDSVRVHGAPAAWYSDRHSCFVRNDKEPWTLAEQFAGRREPTQLARALEQLGVERILAHSPQAKGRIERCWGTLQDRLVKALRRDGAATMDEANVVLAGHIVRHNARFSITAADPIDAHRHVARRLDLDGVCSMHYVRTVTNDNTVRLDERLIQISPGPRRRSYARCRVELQERIDGELVVAHQGVVIARQARQTDAPVRARQRQRGRELPADPPPARPQPEPVADAALPSDVFVPLMSEHPWRRDLMQHRKDKKKGPRRPSAEAPLSFSHEQTIISARTSK